MSDVYDIYVSSFIYEVLFSNSNIYVSLFIFEVLLYSFSGNIDISSLKFKLLVSSFLKIVYVSSFIADSIFSYRHNPFE